MYACIKMAAVSGLEGGPLAVKNRASLSDLLWLNVWAWGHCLVGARDGSRGIDGGLGTMGPLKSRSVKGMMLLDPSKVLLRRVHVPVINRL